MTNQDQKRRDLYELEHSVLRSEALIHHQTNVIAELERDGHQATARSARSLLQAFEKRYREQVARRDWLRRKLGWYSSSPRAG